MEIWIRDEEIINRIMQRISELDEEITLKYSNSNLSMDFYKIIDGENILTHDFIIEFCILTNTNYKYILLGQTPIYDVDNNNYLYKRLIANKDFSI